MWQSCIGLHKTPHMLQAVHNSVLSTLGTVDQQQASSEAVPTDTLGIHLKLRLLPVGALYTTHDMRARRLGGQRTGEAGGWVTGSKAAVNGLQHTVSAPQWATWDPTSKYAANRNSRRVLSLGRSVDQDRPAKLPPPFQVKAFSTLPSARALMRDTTYRR